MKPPKFTGHKKGYAEIWLGEYKKDRAFDRFRLRLPGGRWWWSPAGASEDMFNSPCWLEDEYGPPLSDVGRMKKYDRGCRRETIFLGYFK
jgi:hypothetical protein